MSKTTALYHIVFCTKHREHTIPQNLKTDLYRFIWSEIKALNCTLIRIGGIQNHVHLLVDLNPTVSLATLIKTIKANSSGWMKKDDRFPLFIGWAAEYFASTISPDDKEALIQYINNQETHHKVHTEDDEFSALYSRAGLTYDDRQLI
ncbi:MAG: IS200/IS605 family transposase [Duncaniella sp.]|nr:IS200/IS605 family transposase [Duncaniella sp.]